MWQPDLDEQHVRLKLQVEAKPLVGPGSGTVGDCQKKTGPKRYGRAPILLVLLRVARRPWESGNMLFSKTKPILFLSDNTMLYDVLIAQSRRLIWFLSTLLQVGNAVPPPLGRALGLCIRQALSTPKPN